MVRRNKKLRHNILIVCEGTNTEPQYFASLVSLAKVAWKETHRLFIEIKPKPKLDDEFGHEKKSSNHKTPRKKRQLKTIKETPSEEEYQPEEKYKAVPIRYVREAQEGLVDGVYESAWAVFDKDYHPKHKAAFELAKQEIDGNKVKIAFSSISFEQWILLHFEKNLTAFKKSECKEVEKSIKKSINCGTGNHPDDCYGERCVSGYLKLNTDLTSYSKSVHAASFDKLHTRYPIALENTAWLKYQILKANLISPIYELNPYTDMDNLVKYLLNIEEEIVWMDFHETEIFDGLKIMFSLESADSIQLKLTNATGKTHLFLPDSVYVTDGETNYPLVIEKVLISPNKTVSIPLDIGVYSHLKLNFKPNINQDIRIILLDNNAIL
ncbi:MAG: RloB family protein [Saprospiraceae bacterium]